MIDPLDLHAAIDAVGRSQPALGYVGPGAGIALVTGALAAFLGALFWAASILVWPLRWLYRAATRKRPPGKPTAKRAIVVGLDGLDPVLLRRFMAEGGLPNFARLAALGTFRELETTTPAMSPVAWSTFATGVHPGKHGIFDFLTREPGSYLPKLSSAEVLPSRRHLRFGPFRIPLGKPRVSLLRRSTPFWKLLGQHGIPSTILRVPITFPPDHFDGIMLSAMCTPDLLGSQGTFTVCAVDGPAGPAEVDGSQSVGGQRVPLTPDGPLYRGALPGPGHPLREDGRPLSLPFELRLEGDGATVTIGKERVRLRRGEFSRWVEIAWPLGLGLKLRGIARMRLLDGSSPRLYISPVNVDPLRPVLPIAQPLVFSMFLARLIGRYATLGLAEDTWALNESVLDEDAFLEQAWANHDEREAMFFEMVKRADRGVVACVFDGTDRIQHMFMRFLDEDHPARPRDGRADRYRDVIADTYARCDRMLGRLFEAVPPDRPENLVVVLSDHGFKTFRRGMNVNAWLLREGYLVLKDGRTASGEWWEGVDWDRTRAYGLGLAGIWLNVRGRERQGCVEPADQQALASEIAGKLSGLCDDAGPVAVNRAWTAAELPAGPYTERSPDIVVGYAEGYRASWAGVRGIADGVVFDDNDKAWSGDHCIDPSAVPGVLLANRPLASGRDRASIADLAPTLLETFGVARPGWMDGSSLAP